MTRHRSAAVLLCLLAVLSLGSLAACGDDDDGFGSNPTTTDGGDDTTTTGGGDDTTTTGGGDTTTTTGGASGDSKSVFDLEVGDCFDDPDSTATDVQEVEVFDCDDPHDNEVVHVFDVDFDDFPGEEEIRAEADVTCEEEFENYVGIAFSDSELTGGPLLVPTEDSWEAGDREVVCAAWNPDFSKLEGSIEGSEQ